jgi:endonuclease/exonuclease/phosphatase family metal-dependent hydrolase
MWKVHHEQIERQAQDWRTLRELHPHAALVVAGDFNQDRDGSGWYGTRRGRDLLSRALEGANLACVTDEDVVASGKLRASHLVDHIAVCRRWSAGFDAHLSCWEKTDQDGVRLSDHPTVVVDLVPTTPVPSEPSTTGMARTTGP